MTRISEALRKEAGEAFYAYETVFIERIVRRPGWRLDAKPLQDVLDTGDEDRVRAFIEDMRQGRRELLDAVIAWGRMPL